MTMTLKVKQRRQQRRRAVGYVLITGGWAATIWVSTLLAPPPWLHTTALFVHLASLVVGLGAVLMVEWHALLWATEWRTVRDLRQVDVTLKPPIWAGLIGLLASGALLQPDLEAPTTIVKLLAVLVVSLNGVALTQWTAYLGRFPRKMRFRALPRRARIRFIATAVVSQLAWWTAVTIGMLNSTT
ncbi:hypothetical protein [Agromyces bauzanensis]|uniref:Uncharacterized protein n=1 Tax=Agromyces bauzanensis TaxID=1308924 RepID=A0A917PTN0_9MICO|nr:hypothetical protein [Agromyces bauzanensis]GGJ90740.1 hypothetical protein GCM10011372_31620 [Agromyces bauzanensis]